MEWLEILEPGQWVELFSSFPMIFFNAWLFWRMNKAARREDKYLNIGYKKFILANVPSIAYAIAGFLLLYFNIKFYL